MIFILSALIIVFILYNYAAYDFTEENREFDKISDKRPVILCSSNGSDIIYNNIFDCRIAATFLEEGKCTSGCLGLYSCVNICPDNAISEELQFDPEKCTNCGLCIEICPRNIIEFNNKSPYIACSFNNTVSDEYVMCSRGCTKCYICVSKCPLRAISVNEYGLPVIDAEICNNCGRCIKFCPAGVIKGYDEK